MPAERVPMRCVREILRLKHECGASDRAIARSVGIARSTVGDYLSRLAAAGLSWPLPPTLSDAALEALLFVKAGTVPGTRRRPEPDWPALHRERRRPGVTLMLLWQEYRAAAPAGYGYSRFCELYEEWASRLSPTMRQVHPAGERLFVDYAGQTMEIVDGATGEVRTAQIFVAVLGASSYTYAEATWTQTLPDWIGAHVRALAFFGGVPRQIVPDNLKAGVLKANWYEPGLNPTYQDLATHYGTAILPARPRKPRDKAKVEVGVQVVERWILARLRHQRFFSLAELNAAIAALYQRERTGLGQIIEVPMFETMVQFLLTEHFNARHLVEEGGKTPAGSDELGYKRTMAKWRRPFRTSDGYICWMPYSDRDWRAFFCEVGQEVLAEDPRFHGIAARTQNIEALYALLEGFLCVHPTAHWLSTGNRLGIACAPVQRLEELESDPHLAAVGMFHTLPAGDWKMRAVRNPVRMAAGTAKPQCPPRLGEHGEEILREAGFADAIIARILGSA